MYCLVYFLLCFSVVTATIMRQVQLSRKFTDILSLDLLENEFIYGSSIQCVKTCVEKKCFSAFYWKNEKKCKINLFAYIDLPAVGISDVSWYVLKDPTSYTYYEDIGRFLVLRTGSKTWNNAKTACSSETPPARLFKIDSQKKQDVAQQIAANTGKLFIHIGVYLKVTIFPPSSKWMYIDETDVGYTQWANFLEPKLPTYAALEKLSGYKWAAVDPVFSFGGWICERY